MTWIMVENLISLDSFHAINKMSSNLYVLQLSKASKDVPLVLEQSCSQISTKGAMLLQHVKRLF